MSSGIDLDDGCLTFTVALFHTLLGHPDSGVVFIPYLHLLSIGEQNYDITGLSMKEKYKEPR